MPTSLEHSSFVIGVLDLLHLHHLRLLQHLYCIEAVVVLALNQVYPAERSCTKRPLDLEVLKRIFPLGLTDRIRGRFRCGYVEGRVAAAIVGIVARRVGRIMLRATIVRAADQILNGRHIVRFGAWGLPNDLSPRVHLRGCLGCRRFVGARGGYLVEAAFGGGRSQRRATLLEDGRRRMGVGRRPCRVLGPFLLEKAERRHGVDALSWVGDGGRRHGGDCAMPYTRTDEGDEGEEANDIAIAPSGSQLLLAQNAGRTPRTGQDTQRGRRRAVKLRGKAEE
nr:hypothetical protein CFP56_07590 [Quercus suber]